MADSADHFSASQWIVYLAIAAGLLLVNAFFAAAETSLLSVRDSRISQLVEEGNHRARIVQTVRERRQTMLVAIQIVVTLVAALASSLATAVALAVLHPWGKTAAVAIATICVLFFLSLFGEITPKNWAVNHAERFSLIASPVILASTRMLGALVWLLETLSRLIIRMLGGHRPSSTTYPSGEEIRLIVEEGARFGELEEEEKEMIHNVMEIPGMTAREIMTPRTSIVGVDIGSSLTEVVNLIVLEGHSRIPVYRGTVDDIVGVVHAKDLLRVLHAADESIRLDQFMLKPLHIPESKKVDKLLQEFQSSNSQMAVVVDEYGGTAGLVTMEDVLEEIVGPISDEHDEPEENDIEMIAPGEYVVAGQASLEDVVDHLEIGVNEEDSEGTDTLGGLVFGLLGRVAEPGDVVEYGGWRLVVEKVEGRRVERIRMSQLPAEEDPKQEKNARSDTRTAE